MSICIRSSRTTFVGTSHRCWPSGATETRSSCPQAQRLSSATSRKRRSCSSTRDTSLSRPTPTKSPPPSGISGWNRGEGSARRRDPPAGMMLALEVVPLPVTDIDRALAFYTEQAGFTLDVDYRPTDDFRVVQLTPRGSACSVQLVMADSPGRVHNLQ